jgi:hypothetical protein
MDDQVSNSVVDSGFYWLEDGRTVGNNSGFFIVEKLKL